MSHGLRVVDLIEKNHRLSGEWIMTYDPDGGDPAIAYPTGTVTTTADPTKALHFVNAASALAFLRQTSTRTPQRPDGQPNRPLSRRTISIEPIPE